MMASDLLNKASNPQSLIASLLLKNNSLESENESLVSELFGVK